MNIENTYLKNINNDLIFNITSYRTDNKEYIKKNIKKASKIKPKKIIYIKLDSNINKFINDSLKDNNFDVIVIYSDKKFEYKYNFTPLYPILINKNDNKVFILTHIQAELLNGFNKDCVKKEDYSDDFIYRCTKIYGGLISNKSIKYLYFKKTLEGFKELYRKSIFKRFNINNIKNTNHLIKHEQGWLSDSTKNNLIYAIKKFKPKVIVEFGTWFGSSSKLIKQTDPNSVLFCFDSFQPVLHTSYPIKKYHPLDEFYFSIPRIETFHKNMESFDKIYSVVGNIEIDDVIKMLIDNKINVDLFFIDFEKKTYKLNKIITSLLNNFPNCNIVGDDFGFDSVKESIYTQLLILNRKVAFSKESYIISNEIMNDYIPYLKENLSKEKKSENILKFVNEKIFNSNIKSIIKKEHIKAFINKCLELGNFSLLLRFFEYNKIDLNSIEYTINKMTLFHSICKYLNIYDSKKKIHEFYKYQKPEKKKDLFLLTYEDYLNYKININ